MDERFTSPYTPTVNPTMIDFLNLLAHLSLINLITTLMRYAVANASYAIGDRTNKLDNYCVQYHFAKDRQYPLSRYAISAFNNLMLPTKYVKATRQV
jgi:hypothetical protein